MANCAVLVLTFVGYMSMQAGTGAYLCGMYIHACAGMVLNFVGCTLACEQALVLIFVGCMTMHVSHLLWAPIPTLSAMSST